MLTDISQSSILRALPFTALVALVGCEQTSEAADQLARSSAKVAVNETLATRIPGIPKQAVTPFTDCVIDNATAREIGEFATAAVAGVTDNTATQVRTVLVRPETQNCIFQAGLETLTT
jgi:hypothetical protein